MTHLDLDGARLFFDRKTGKNILMRGKETAHLQQHAPRVVQLSITNACNKTCGFCYRDLDSKSRWDFDSLLDFSKYLCEWGVLELALGGGEPTVFPKFETLVQRIWNETQLSVNFTTNGTRLDRELLKNIKTSIGQIQVSVYDDENLDEIIDLLVENEIRFGLNYLITPKRLKTLDADLLSWASKGVKDVLLLSYKGRQSNHLSAEELLDFDSRIIACQRYLAGKMQLKLDVCWSSRLPKTPQLFYEDDCRAGALFMSVTSDKKVVSCSFAEDGIAFEGFEELPGIYARLKRESRGANQPGCARLPNFGISESLLIPAIDYPEVRI